jgi:quercetin dioxygenase-like cupin family protein
MATESPILASSQEHNVEDRVKILELDKAQPVDYDWGSIKWICDRKVTPDSLQSFGYAFVTPGKNNQEHRHMTCEEIIYMLAGELPGQTALIPKGVRHKVVNEGWEPVVYIASFSAAFRDTVFKGQTAKLELPEKLY